MAILDLQKLQAPAEERAGRSAASKKCGGQSTLSVALCR
jgi:Lanthionine-containing peptide SapB precursor RamS